MNQIPTWVTILASVSAGGILIKLLDIIWLQRVQERREYHRWLREERLKAFTELLTLLSSFGKFPTEAWNPWDLQGVASKSLLLIGDDDDLRSQINATVNKINDVMELEEKLKRGEISKAEVLDEYHKAGKLAGKLMIDLSQSLRGPNV